MNMLYVYTCPCICLILVFQQLWVCCEFVVVAVAVGEGVTRHVHGQDQLGPWHLLCTAYCFLLLPTSLYTATNLKKRKYAQIDR